MFEGVGDVFERSDRPAERLSLAWPDSPGTDREVPRAPIADPSDAPDEFGMEEDEFEESEAETAEEDTGVDLSLGEEGATRLRVGDEGERRE